jgi:hypothetical protein
MLRGPQILFFVATTLVLCGDTRQDATKVIGRLSVPAKFIMEVYDYREGIGIVAFFETNS